MKTAAQADFYIDKYGPTQGIEYMDKLGYEGCVYSFVQLSADNRFAEWTDEELESYFSSFRSALKASRLQMPFTLFDKELYSEYGNQKSNALKKQLCKQAIRATSYMGCDTIVVRLACIRESRSDAYDITKKINCEILTELKEVADAVGVHLAFLNASKEWCFCSGTYGFGCRASELLELVKQFGVGVVINPHYALDAGERVEEMIEELGDKLIGFLMTDKAIRTKSKAFPMMGHFDYDGLIRYFKKYSKNDASIVSMNSYILKRYEDFENEQSVVDALSLVLYKMTCIVAGRETKGTFLRPKILKSRIRIGTLRGVLANLDISEQDVYKKISEAGFDSIDYSFMTNYQHELWQLSDEELRERMEKVRDSVLEHGLIVGQTHAPVEADWNQGDISNEERWRPVVQAIKATSYLGAPYSVIHPLIPEGRRSEQGYYERAKELNMEFYRYLEPYLKEYNVKAAIENLFINDKVLMKTGKASCSTAEDLMDYIDTLDSDCFVVCLDVGHAVLAGQDPIDMIYKLGKEYLHVTHIHDNDSVNDDHYMPGIGHIDWLSIGRALNDIGYEDVFSYEANRTFRRTAQYANELALPFLDVYVALANAITNVK